MKYKILFTLFVFFISCGVSDNADLTQFVDPMIGTGGHDHTFPGATLPYGMVQLSPDTRTETWDGCSGYHYSDKSILGFSHTHFSGTGGGGGGDILLMPTTGEIKLTVGDSSDTKSGYRSAFSHKNEHASPGYYSVLLDDYGIKAELTATTRVGFQKYTFPKIKQGNIILDLAHGIQDVVDSSRIHIDKNEITGFRASSKSLAGVHVTYFVIKFSKPFSNYGLAMDGKIEKGIHSAKGKNIKAFFKFDVDEQESVMAKTALSMVSVEGAKKNLDAELPGWDFAATVKAAEKAWNKELNKIRIEGATDAQKRTFYTAMYHAFIQPNIYMDVDRRYKSTNKKIYTANDFDDYTTFSLWDTFRALHPLQTIINRKRTNQFIRTFIARYKHASNFPIMEFSGDERFAMIGYHSLPVVADAYVKGIRDYDVKAAFAGMKQLADSYRAGKKYYKQYGFIPYDLEGESVSRTLEYSYDDWCVAQVAKDFSEKDYEYFSSRGQFYRNLFSKETGFMQPKSSSYVWLDDFDPMEATNYYTEANAWQYTPFVPQDIEGLIELMGGDEKFEKWLDKLFTTETDPGKMKLADVTGNIGQYAQGNEPSHHIAYLYDYVGAPWKTQKLIRQILTTLYKDQPDGISGNEDCGQMSAWYILSALGIYAVTPGMDYFVIGSPLFAKATINLENGKKFVITASNNGLKNPYIQSARLNGAPYYKTYLNYADIINGGELCFTMGEKPNKEYGRDKKDRPYSIKFNSAPIPQFKFINPVFLDKTKITISCDDNNASIRYTLDGSVPNENSFLYTQPIILRKSAQIKARSFKQGAYPSYPVWVNFRKITLQPALDISNVQPGLLYRYREGLCHQTSEMKNYPVLKSGVIPTFNIDAVKDERAFAYTFDGYIKIPQSGVYTFSLASNDGAVLFIDGNVLLDNDGYHKAQAIIAKVGLNEGFHSIKVDYFQMGRAKKLVVKVQVPDMEMKKVPAKMLFHL